MPNYVYIVYIGVQLVCLIINKDVKLRLLWAQCLCFLTLNQKQVQTLLMHRSCTVCPDLPSHTRYELHFAPVIVLVQTSAQSCRIDGKQCAPWALQATHICSSLKATSVCLCGFLQGLAWKRRKFSGRSCYLLMTVLHLVDFFFFWFMLFY